MTANDKNSISVNTHGDINVPSGMLTSPHIAYCINKYDMIKNHDMSCLRSATYDMRIGGSVLTWAKGEKIEFELGEINDINKNIYNKVELKPNSLTFVTTIEEFNLPKDIIARFNLKSKWVHEGLLLGTGPIVDPELKARLLIPLHNFSSQDITLNYGDEFISVEFTKTLNPDDKIKTELGDFSYIPNRNAVFDFHKYRKRIGGKKVESSVLSTLEAHESLITEYKKRLSIFSWGGAFAFAAMIVGLIALIFTTWSLLSSTFTTYNEAANIVKQYSEDNIDYRAFALKNTAENQQIQMNELKAELDRYKNMVKPSHQLGMEVEQLRKRVAELEKASANK